MGESKTVRDPVKRAESQRRYAQSDKGKAMKARAWKRYRERNRDKLRGQISIRTQERRDITDRIKLERGCIDCGYAEHPAALDFDHRDDAEKVNHVAKMLLGPLEALMEEIEKCDVRCANCHRIRTSMARRSAKRGGKR